MAPPITKHQYIIGNIYYLLRKSFEDNGNNNSISILSPYEVVFPSDYSNPSEKHVLEPDIITIEEKDALYLAHQKRYEGVPKFIIEVLSPSTQRRDWGTKLNQYEYSGVEEYWIVDPIADKIHAHVLDKITGKFSKAVYSVGNMVSVMSFSGLPSLSVDDIFQL